MTHFPGNHIGADPAPIPSDPLLATYTAIPPSALERELRLQGGARLEVGDRLGGGWRALRKTPV